jgi:hypothetical protein
MVEQDPNGTYIDHIDCWGKFLAPNKVLIRKVPTSHPQYDEIEATAAFYASQVSSYGTLYKVYRVNTPNNEPYTNSFIMKNKVCVPIMGTANDAAAILAYKMAMPGYQVLGFLGNSSTPWESTDALHCRTHEMADLGMLMISHLPLHDTLTAQACFRIDADINAFSGLTIYPDSVWTIYKVNAGDWDTLAMTHTTGTQWTACIPGQMEGSVISYYIHAEDASNRSSSHPYIGAPDPHKFSVKSSLRVTPDTLLFLNFDEMTNGKTAMVRNYTNHEVVIDQINNTGENPFVWNIDPWNITLPYTMQAGDTLSLTVKLAVPVTDAGSLLCDTLFVNTAFSSAQVSICVDPYLFSGISTSSANTEFSVYPNPMNGSAAFSFRTEKDGLARIEVFSLMGQLVSIPCSEMLTAGTHVVGWEGRHADGQKLLPGIYLYRILSGDKLIGSGKVLIVKG